MNKYITIILGLMLFASCARVPLIMLSDNININLEQNSSDGMVLYFHSDLSDKHRTNRIVYKNKEGKSTNDFTPRKTNINQTFIGLLDVYLSKKFNKYKVDSTGYSINVTVNSFKIPKPESSKKSSFHVITDYILEGSLEFHVSLKNNGNIISEKNFLAESSVSYSVDDIKNEVLDTRNELITKVCNIGVGKIQNFLKNNNL